MQNWLIINLVSVLYVLSNGRHGIIVFHIIIICTQRRIQEEPYQRSKMEHFAKIVHGL